MCTCYLNVLVGQNNDADLCVHAIGKMWSCVLQHFEGGAVSIRRTQKSLSRTAVDLTLEQTVNKDAASRQGDIAAFILCVKVRKRWTLTRSFRGAVVGTVIEMAGLTLADTIS